MQKKNNKSNLALIKNSYKEEWNKIEKKKSSPKNFSKIVTVDHKEFVDKIFSQNSDFVQSTIESIYNGDLYILKNAIGKEKVNHIKEEIHNFTLSKPSTFHKMLEGTPNFHRWIDKKASNDPYSLRHVKHSTYLFSWNEDISGIRKIINQACCPLKFLSGLSTDEYTNNTPKDKIVERLQVTRYPPTGFVEPHLDPDPLMRFVISGYLSKRGVDYQEGGFYMIDEKNGKLDLEIHIDAGDIGFFYATLRHGVDEIDAKKIPDFNKKNGRWWFGYNIHNSDIIRPESRHTGIPYNINSKV